MDSYETRLAGYEDQIRAKYTQAERDEMAKSGEAMSDGSYPIADKADLKNAIRAVGRGNADHSAIRKHIIKRAKSLGASASIPENWASDGTLTDKKAALWLNWQERQKEITPVTDDDDDSDDMWNSDLSNLLSGAVCDEFSKKGYVCDFNEDTVIYCVNGDCFQASYTVDGGKVDFGKQTEVERVTSYVEKKSAEMTIPAVPKKHWSQREIDPPAVADFQVRADEGATEATLVGWASTTGDAYPVLDWMGEYDETIMPGAFGKTLKESDYIPYLVDHKGDVLASWHQDSGRTMDMAEDGRGLRTEAHLDIIENTSSRNLVSGVKRGDYSKMSFAFRATKEDWNEAYTKRSVLECQVFDASVVKSPANKLTAVGLRSDVLDIIGREGVTTFRTAQLVYGQFIEVRSLAEGDEPVFEDAIRALKFMDERMTAQSQYMYCSRARTFAVVNCIEQLRQGKTISSANEQLLKDALDALGQGANGLKTAATGNAEAATAIRATLGDSDPQESGTKASNNGGLDTGKLNDGNPVLPNDGAGVRSIPLAVRLAKAQAEVLRLRSIK